MAEKVNSIDFDEGLVKFHINGDPNRSINIDPMDFNIIPRAREANQAMRNAANELAGAEISSDGTPSGDEAATKAAAEVISKIDSTIKEQFDYIFGYPVSEAIFAGRSALSHSNGSFLFERAFTACFKQINAAMEKEAKAAQNRTAKYTAPKKAKKTAKKVGPSDEEKSETDAE